MQLRQSAALPAKHRWWLAGIGMALLALLLIATMLSPDARGHGTHEQLGLPPCTFMALWGRPCPSCGMTTSWANLVRGHLTSAIRANACGTILGIMALVGAVWMPTSAIAGRWIFWRPRDTDMAVLAVALTGLILVQWILRLTIWG